MALSRAFLGNESVQAVFAFNPMSANWSYSNNQQAFDTIGGRVVQLLSVAITDITVQGVAGSRKELQRFVNNIQKIMKYHVATQLPVHFRVPSRKWDFRVYVKAMPQVGWDVTTVSYPFQLTLSVTEDVTGVKSRAITTFELDRLKASIGYNQNFHGGNPGAFANIISKLDLTKPGTPAVAGSGGTGAPGTVGDLAQVIVNAAQSQLGVPYVYATEDPRGQGTGQQGGREHDTSGASFDCSGLSQWCYAQAGIDIPGTARSQQDFLTLHPNKNQLQPADLVFFWYPNSRGIPSSQASHVGIYIGNGKMIDAPGTGLQVRTEDVTWSSFIGAGRSPQVYQSTQGSTGGVNPNSGVIPGAVQKPLSVLTGDFSKGAWTAAPLGVLLHFTDGCGSPWATLNSRKKSVHAAVLQDGTVEQYAPLGMTTEHAFQASIRYFGIESAARPEDGSCNLNVTQLNAIAKTAAYMMDWAQQSFNTVIPTVRNPGASLSNPGLKCHTDGLDPSANWDPNRHWDSPCRASGDPTDAWISSSQRTALNKSPWTWATMLSAIQGYRQ